MEHGQMDRLKEDVKEKFEKAKETFPFGAEGLEDPENAGIAPAFRVYL